MPSPITLPLRYQGRVNEPLAVTFARRRELGLWATMRGDARDASGHNHPPTIAGTTLTTDRFGRPNFARSFDGVDDYTEYPDHPRLRLTPPFVISAWLLRASISADRSFLSKYSGDSGNWKSYSCDFPLDNTLRFRTENKILNQFPFWTTTATFTSTSAWLHIAIVMSAITGAQADVRIWVNGVEQQVTLTQNNYTSGYQFRYGATPLGLGVRENDARTGFFPGRIGDVRLYNTLLSDQEILRLSQYRG